MIIINIFIMYDEIRLQAKVNDNNKLTMHFKNTTNPATLLCFPVCPSSRRTSPWGEIIQIPVDGLFSWANNVKRRRNKDQLTQGALERETGSVTKRSGTSLKFPQEGAKLVIHSCLATCKCTRRKQGKAITKLGISNSFTYPFIAFTLSISQREREYKFDLQKLAGQSTKEIQLKHKHKNVVGSPEINIQTKVHVLMAEFQVQQNYIKHF